MTDCQHVPQHYMHGGAHLYRCSICGIQLFSTTTNAYLHPSLCRACGHARNQHDGGCNVSVREGLDGVKRCECLENYGEPS